MSKQERIIGWSIFLAQSALVILRLAGVIHWHWAWVWSPFLAIAGLYVLILGFAVVLGAFD